jgi:hypothetical protein
MTKTKIKIKKPRVPERDIKKEIRDLCNRWPYALFTNAVGAFRNKNGSFFRYGLGVGTSDLIGWKTITITPDMIGQRIAQFVAIEVKAADGCTSPKQSAFLQSVSDAGGLATVVRSASEAVQDLEL